MVAVSLKKKVLRDDKCIDVSTKEKVSLIPVPIWAKEVVDQSCDTGFGLDMKLNSLNQPCISYSDFSPNNSSNIFIKYAHRIGPKNWEIEVVDESSARCCLTSLAIDSSDTPHIAYIDGANDQLKYACRTESGWQITVLDDHLGAMESISGPRIAIDSQDRPHIAYYDHSTHCLMHLWKNPERRSQWRSEVVDHAYLDWNPSIAIDPVTDQVRIVYGVWVGWDLHVLKQVTRLDDGNWYEEYIDLDGGVLPHLAIASNGRSRVVYSDGYDVWWDNLCLMYAEQHRWNDWSIELMDPEIRSGTDASIALDPSGNPHILHIAR